MTKQQMSLIAAALSALVAAQPALAVSRSVPGGAPKLAPNLTGAARHNMALPALGLPALPFALIPGAIPGASLLGPKDEPAASGKDDAREPMADRLKGVRKAVDGLGAQGENAGAGDLSEGGQRLEDALTGASS